MVMLVQLLHELECLCRAISYLWGVLGVQVWDYKPLFTLLSDA